MTTNERLALHRKNRRNKTQLEASQEMINAFDKISVSVRRAHNVNRCQQDHLDSKVWTLETEHRKSMGLLAFEQRRFIRARKSSNIPLKLEKNRKLSNFSVVTQNDSVKTSVRLPTLVGKQKFHSDDSVESFKRHALNRNGFAGSRRRYPAQKQDVSKHILLPSIQETQLNKVGEYKEKDSIEPGRDSTDRWLTRNTNARRDVIDKQQYVASWDLSACEETLKKPGKSDSNLAKTSLTLNSKQGTDESTCTRAHYDSMIAEIPGKNWMEKSITGLGVKGNDIENEPPSLTNTKISSVRQGTNTTSELESILDKTTEIRVKQFLKLPSIGGICESPEPANSDGKDQKQGSYGKETSSQNNSHKGKQRANSSLWKNLVHCRYLRLGKQHICEHKITNKSCECNWCAMVRKSRA